MFAVYQVWVCVMKECCLSIIIVKTTLQFLTFILSRHRNRHTNTNDSLMFGLAPILPMSDVQIGPTLITILASASPCGKFWHLKTIRQLSYSNSDRTASTPVLNGPAYHWHSACTAAQTLTDIGSSLHQRAHSLTHLTAWPEMGRSTNKQFWVRLITFPVWINIVACSTFEIFFKIMRFIFCCAHGKISWI